MSGADRRDEAGATGNATRDGADEAIDDTTRDAARNAASAAPPSRVRLRILDKEVQLACPPDEEEKLRQAAAYVDRAMRETRQRNTTSSLEKIAIVTAINTASSLLEARSRAGDDGGAATRVARLNARLDELLTARDGGVTPARQDGAGGIVTASGFTFADEADDETPDASEDASA